MYKINIQQLHPSSGDRKWCLDFPQPLSDYDVKTLQTDGLSFQGWVLIPAATKIEPYVRTIYGSQYFNLNVQRPDVVSIVLKQDPKNNSQLHCGFKFILPIPTERCYFGFRIDGWDCDFAILTIEGSLKVLEGKNGWLFLDNDTNKSVEQYQGKLLLNHFELNAWQHYLDQFYAEVAKRNIQHCLLISPSKEMILSDHYPYKKGKTTPIEQVLQIAHPKHAVVYPEATFKQSKARPFRICDTHWSPYGAMLASIETLAALKLDTANAKELFASDSYRECMVIGDLGNKIYPPRSATENVLSSYNYRKSVVYDNQLPNFGRVMLLNNPAALNHGKCILFGSSSSYSMLDYFARSFTDITFIHTAGNIDISIIEAEQPDFIVAQTNARFVITAPCINYNLRSTISEKLSTLSNDECAKIVKNSANQLEKSDHSALKFYHHLLQSHIESV